MASLAKEYTQEKLFGQVYTPTYVVCEILDEIGFNCASMLGSTILDPACGDGRFLTEIAKRIVALSPKNRVVENLEKIHGWDIDVAAIDEAIKNLNKLVRPLKIDVNWNVSVVNSIAKLEQPTLFSTCAKIEKFDYIVGNPPYVRIQHLDLELREYIKSNYKYCKSGSTDIYIAFFELCYNLLSDNGVCGLITPNTFFYTETARLLRQHFVVNRNLVKITNYGDIQLFDDATTYSAITIFDKKHRDKFVFQKALSGTEFETADIEISSLNEPFWQLSTENINGHHGVKLGKVAKIHVGITTLCDKVYIFGVEDVDERYVLAKTKIAGEIKLERSILKPIIKGSTLKSGEQQITEWVLFPYKRIDGKHTIIPEVELEREYPLAYRYLCAVRTELDNRDNGKINPVAWYAFGRSQGLDTSFGQKIIFSPMNQKPNFVYYKNEDCTFYSGYCIKYKSDIKKLLSQLNSERMQRFISISSRDYRGGWKAYNKRVVENYVVEL